MLPTLAQGFGQQDPNQTQFQSTSTMTGSGSNYAPNPSLNSSGTAPAPTAAPSFNPGVTGGPNRDMEYNYEFDDNDTGSPVGDAVVPLMVMALAYAVYSAVRVYRRKRRL